MSLGTSIVNRKSQEWGGSPGRREKTFCRLLQVQTRKLAKTLTMKVRPMELSFNTYTPSSPHSPFLAALTWWSSLIGNSHRHAHSHGISATVLMVIQVPSPPWLKESIMISSTFTWHATLEPCTWCCSEMYLCSEAEWASCDCWESSDSLQNFKQPWFPTALKGRRRTCRRQPKGSSHKSSHLTKTVSLFFDATR